VAEAEADAADVADRAEALAADSPPHSSDFRRHHHCLGWSERV